MPAHVRFFHAQGVLEQLDIVEVDAGGAGAGELGNLELKLLEIRAEGVGPGILPAPKVLCIEEPLAEGHEGVDAVVEPPVTVDGGILLDDGIHVPGALAFELDAEAQELVLAEVDSLPGEVFQDQVAETVIRRGPAHCLFAFRGIVDPFQGAGVAVGPLLDAALEIVDDQHLRPYVLVSGKDAENQRGKGKQTPPGKGTHEQLPPYSFGSENQAVSLYHFRMQSTVARL